MTYDIAEYLTSLKGSKKFGPQVNYHKKYAPIEAVYANTFPKIALPLQTSLLDMGIPRLYTHQFDAIQSILAGRNVIVATPTASGKTLIYNLPVLNDLFQKLPGHSLYIFPLKALAQDQFAVLNKLYNSLPDHIVNENSHFSALFDGDTTPYMRKKIRNCPPRVLLTNPEMIHLSLLPYHHNWATFFSALRYIVIDEVHSYRGVFGSHMAWVIRRLLRIADHYGATPTFILLSATVGNPEKLGSLLIDEPVEVIHRSGSPQAEKNTLFLNPWDSAAYTASQLLEAAIKRKLRTIVYTQSRKLTELINLWTRPKLGILGDKLTSYRAGFLPEERREIEQRLFSGDLLGVISTSALELGIDIGNLDLCILVGYPGSIMATLQRGGRVGRAMRKSATILIAQEDALDQHFMRNPEDFFRRRPESAVLNPENSTIMGSHLLCAAAELPLAKSEKIVVESKEVLQKITCQAQLGHLLETAAGGQWISPRKYPQREVHLRGAGRQLSIIDGENGEVIGEIDSGRAMKECHPEAVYLHRAVSWVVERIDLIGGEVVVKRERPKYFTRPMSEKRTEILELIEKKSSFGVQVSFGKIRVTERVTGFQKRSNTTQKLISTTPLDLPEQIIETEGLWIDIHGNTVNCMEQLKYHFMGAIHAFEHALIALFPLLVLCDRNDIGGISCPMHEQTEMASIFIYDGYPGGVGLTQEAFYKVDTLLRQTEQAVSSCECETGCPSCVHSPKCGSGNRPIDKKACLFLLNNILTENHFDMKINAHLTQTKSSQKNLQKEIEIQLPAKRGMDVLPDNFGVFDVETIRSAEEVGGWARADRMGVSVAVVYDSAAGESFTYLEHEIKRFIKHLESFDMIVGFNNKRFDNRVLSAYTTISLNALPTLDLLEEVHAYLGYRLSLNRLAEETLGTTKTSDGLQALKWYRQGRIDLIQQYCKKDVEITRDLLYHCLEKGFLLFKNKAGKAVRLPLALDESIRKILCQKNQGHRSEL